MLQKQKSNANDQACDRKEYLGKAEEEVKRRGVVLPETKAHSVIKEC
jgi:phage protein U